MDATQIEMLDGWFAEASLGVCEAFALEASPLASVLEEFENIAVIGFAGSNIRGTLGVAASQQVLEALLKNTGSTEISSVMMLDCLGELANQTLGRLKNTLCRHGVDISMSTPMVLRGLRISIDGTHQNLFLRRDFSTPYGRVSTWLDGHGDEGLAFQEATEETYTQDEGDMLFF